MILGFIKSIIVYKTLRIYIGDLKLVAFSLKHLIMHKKAFKTKMLTLSCHQVGITNNHYYKWLDFIFVKLK